MMLLASLLSALLASAFCSDVPRGTLEENNLLSTLSALTFIYGAFVGAY